MLFNFGIYTGNENRKGEPNSEAIDNIVIRQLRIAPDNLSYSEYFDNYDSILPLLAELSKRGILCFGTLINIIYQIAIKIVYQIAIMMKLPNTIAAHIERFDTSVYLPGAIAKS